jgi:alpha-1,3/alpha-1,6-mannosyltransferase
VNRFERKKQIDLAIRAFSRLRDLISEQDFNTLQLVIAGGYDDRVHENVEYHRELQALSAGLNLTHETKWSSSSRPVPDAHVLFVPSFTMAQRQYLLSSAVALVYTPPNEHFGIVPIEAMASKVPVVAVDSGGPRETVIEGVGWRCQPNAEDFAQCLKTVCSMNSFQRTAMGQRGQEWVESKFSLEAFSHRLESMLKELVGSRPRSHLFRRLVALCIVMVVFVMMVKLVHRIAQLYS